MCRVVWLVIKWVLLNSFHVESNRMIFKTSIKLDQLKDQLKLTFLFNLHLRQLCLFLLLSRIYLVNEAYFKLLKPCIFFKCKSYIII